ncbi:MAG: hypothetical protein J5744_03970 [Oscillospiraceae bacterium]|nr:hypothetical protein [Oscillospiraceae bacterium]
MLTGRQAAAAIKQKASDLCTELNERGIIPALAIIGVGENSYGISAVLALHTVQAAA